MMIELICSFCGKTFNRSNSFHNANVRSDQKNLFCSRQCNFDFKRSKKINKCVSCKKSLTSKKAKYCDNCRKKSWSDARSKINKTILMHEDVTLTDWRTKYSVSQYHAKIRGHARLVYSKSNRPMVCYNCQYSLHVDICHIKDVKDFDLITPISVVNDINNLVALDKRCHWEFDNGYLELGIVD